MFWKRNLKSKLLNKGRKFHYLVGNNENNNIKNNLDLILKQIRIIDVNFNMKSNLPKDKKQINNKQSIKRQKSMKKPKYEDDKTMKYTISLAFDEENVPDNRFDKNNFLNVNLNFLQNSKSSKSGI